MIMQRSSAQNHFDEINALTLTFLFYFEGDVSPPSIRHEKDPARQMCFHRIFFNFGNFCRLLRDIPPYYNAVPSRNIILNCALSVFKHRDNKLMRYIHILYGKNIIC